VIQLTRETARWDPAAVREARARFDAQHWIKLRGFLAGPLLERVQNGIGRATFTEVIHRGVTPPSIDVCMDPNPTSALLELLCNDAALFHVIEAITGCSPLTRFSGFVYRLSPGTGHHHNWHNDMIQNRRVAMSVNLESAPYTGGLLQIRRRESEEILFRIDAALQHRATAVTSGVKTAFAGWFRSAPSLRDDLAHLAASHA
jgi:hypothetical protein